MSEEDVEVKFGASIEGLLKGVDEAKEALEGLTEPLAGIKEAFSELGEAFMAALAFEKIAEFAEHMGELGEQTERTSKMLGISTEDVGKLNYAAAMTGTSTEGLTMMMGRFESGLAGAEKGTGRVAAGLKSLGLSAEELAHQNISKQLGTIAEAVSKFADGPAKTAALQDLGHGFVQLIPLLDEGKEGIDEFSKGAEEAGIVLDEKLTAQLVGMEHATVNLGQNIQGLSISVFKPFIGVVDGAVAILTDFVKTLRESVEQGGVLTPVVYGLAVAFRAVETAVGGLMISIEQWVIIADGATKSVAAAFIGMGKAIGEVFDDIGKNIPEFFRAMLRAAIDAAKGIGQQFVNLGSLIKDALSLNMSAAKADFGSFGTTASDSLSKIGGEFSKSFDFSNVDDTMTETAKKIEEISKDTAGRVVDTYKTAKKELGTIWGTGGSGEEGGEKPPNPMPQDQGRGGKNEALKDIEAQTQATIDASKREEEATQESLDEQLKTKQISMSKWLAATLAAYDKEADAVQDAYEKELQAAGLTSAQKIAIANKEENALAAIAHKEAAAQAKAAEDSLKTWDTVTKQINSAFDSQVNGLLKGTTSWSQALKNVLASLTEDVIKFFVDWGLKAAENVALQVASQNSVTAGIVAALGLQGAAQAGAGKAGALASIQTDVGQAFAGFAAFFAPTLGPGALGAAGELASNVDEVASGIAAADIGMWQVPGDQLAMIHKNELIMPAAESGAFRSMLSNAANGDGGGGGGDTTHNHTWNIQSSSADARDVARQVAALWNRNPSMRPAF